jgi:release factor glutamine methyltransferase
MTVQDHIEAARHRLLNSGLEPNLARIDAEVLARDLLGWDMARLLADAIEPATDAFVFEYGRRIDRRTRREPVAYITGTREFWGLAFEVTSEVLIPRPETEALVEQALDEVRRRGRAPSWIVDAGTGSGCIGIAIATELSTARLVATDVAPGALVVAQRNAERHGVAGRVHFAAMDLLSALDTPLELIVSNPPYVPDSARRLLQRDVRGYEPGEALFGGFEGLELIQRLLQQADAGLAPGGALILEFGDGQEEAVRALMQSSRRLRLDRIYDDLQGIARVAIIRNPAA